MPFLLLIFLSFHSEAVTLSKVMSRPEGTSVQAYEIVKGKGKLIRKTNDFGPKNDLRLGVFTSKADLKKAEKKISSLSPKEDYKNLTGHGVYFKVNDKFVNPASPLQSQLEKVFASLQEKDWDFLEGIELSSDLTEMSEWESGKVKQKNIFPQSHYCEQVGKDQVCKFKDRGILYVR
jgi:hypothetical protein